MAILSLLQKLGIRYDQRVLVIHPPFTFTRYLHKHIDKNSIEDTPLGIYSYIHIFPRSQADLSELFPILKKHITKDGLLWVSWPKGQCTIATDLNENIMRDIGLGNGLVDVKVVSIDENWSALKFVYRIENRD